MTLLLAFDPEGSAGAGRRAGGVFIKGAARLDATSPLPTLFPLAPDLVAQNLRHERHQLAKTGDVRYLPRGNVLDPADHAAWQLGAHVQVQDEGAVGGQFERIRFRGRQWRGSRNVPLLSHAPDNTGRRSHARWNRREIGVRRWLEDGFRGDGS
jgi:hypothetical protein